jgi:hypothetical protein
LALWHSSPRFNKPTVVYYPSKTGRLSSRLSLKAIMFLLLPPLMLHTAHHYRFLENVTGVEGIIM